MRTMLLSALGALIVLFVTIAVLIAIYFARLKQRNRVDPDIETIAPLSWLSNPTAPARLHRRLHDAIAPIHVPAKPSRRDGADGPFVDLQRALAARAVEVDRHVVLAARLSGKQRRGALRSLRTNVTEIERLSGRMVQLRQPTRAQLPGAGGDAPDPAPDVLAELSNNLDLLENAHSELAEIERASGLVAEPLNVEPYGRRDEAP